jgi:AraC-like DNA-binding protein
MNFIFDSKNTTSPFVEAIWRTQSLLGGSFISPAVSTWEMVVTRQYGKIMMNVRGPETRATLAPIPENAEFLGITFKQGTFMPYLPVRNLVDAAVNLPTSSGNAFWLNGSLWQFPDFENAETFISKLVGQGLLVNDAVVQDALLDRRQQISVRSMQRRFVNATGLTFKALQQIERARQASQLLEEAVPILEVVHLTGYFDQSHLTNSLKRFIGQTPAQMLKSNQPE